MLALALDVNIPDSMPHGHALGIDLGLEKFLATSNNQLITRPKFFVDAQRKLKSLQKVVSRKRIGSKNWQKAQRKVARYHQHISDSRKDFHFKTAHHLCKQDFGEAQSSTGMIFAEDLNVKAMSRGMLCKHTLDAGFGQFLSILEYVCFKEDVFFLKVDKNGTS